MKDYSDLGLDSRLRSFNTPKATVITGVDFDALYDAQSKRIKTSKAVVKDLVRLSPAGSAAYNGFPPSTSATFYSNLGGDPGYTTDLMLGIPHIAIYEGTSAVYQNMIYPTIGNNIQTADYNCYSGYNYRDFGGTTNDWRIYIENNTGGTVNIYGVVQWIFIQNRSGSSAPV